MQRQARMHAEIYGERRANARARGQGKGCARGTGLRPSATMPCTHRARRATDLSLRYDTPLRLPPIATTTATAATVHTQHRRGRHGACEPQGMTCHPIRAEHRPNARVAQGWRLSRGQVGSLTLSIAVHAAVVLGAVLTHRSLAPAELVPVAFAVERSLLSHEAAAAAPPPIAEVSVEPETTPDEPIADSKLEPPPEPITPPPPDHRQPIEPREVDDRRLRECARSAVRPIPRPATTASPTTPTEAPPAPTPARPQVARPDVPVVIPGQNPAPEYPAFARRRNIEGTVLVRIDVGANGEPTSCTVVASSGCTSLDFAALAAARRWRFVNGPGPVEVPFVFQIRS